MTLQLIIEAITCERARQQQLMRDGKFRQTCASKFIGDGTRLTILAKAFGEIARGVCEVDPFLHLSFPPAATREHDEKIKTELIQLAAVAVAWLESFPEGGES